MKFLKFGLFYLPVLSVLISVCNTTEPPPEDKRKLTLTFEDASCTEVWLTLETENLQLPVDINLITTDPDGNLKSQILNLKSKDLLLYVDSLLPNKSYKLKASSIQNPVSSNEITAITMDTTSHNFTWQKFTFGVGASSIFRDVAIIDENNIYAVGEIYLNDSLGNPDLQPYCIAKWDGENWNFKKLFYNSNLIITSVRGILILNHNNIYLAAGSIFHWDGLSSSVQLVYSRLNLPDPNATIEKLWTNLNSSIYGVGNAGTIVFYNGQTWQKIESGTDLPVNDINGSVNPFTNDIEIICVAADFFEDRGVQLISIKENNASELLDNAGLVRFISSVWFMPGMQYYIVGNGLYEKTYEDTLTWVNLNHNQVITPNLMESIRGNELNDIIVTGDFGEVIHFNGSRWISIKNSETSLNNGSYLRVAVKEDIVAAVGYDGSQAVILIGHHQ